MTNSYFLSNGQNFIVNPSLEVDVTAARYSKKVFLLGLNVVDLSTDKAWAAKAIQALATGMVHIGGEGKNRATKAVLIERLSAYIAEERLTASITDTNDRKYVETVLDDCSFSVAKLELFMTTLTGQDLIDALASLILSRGLAPSTITKTVIPDIVKLLKVHYKGSDILELTKGLYTRFKALNQAVNNATTIKTGIICRNRTNTDWKVLAPFVENILDNVETVSWKHLSFAIAIATGRRQGEVHGIGTSFSVVDSGHVLFSGQLKTKTKGVNPPAVIPCLFDAYKVVSAWERLRTMNRASYTPEAVNSAVGKALSTEMPKDIRDIKAACNLVAYKDNRDCYGAYCLLSKPQHYSTAAYLSTIMGHGENDDNTAKTYDKRSVTI